MSEITPPTEKTQRADTGAVPPQAAPENVKIYDRPERSGLSPLAMILIALILLLVAFVAYKAFVH